MVSASDRTLEIVMKIRDEATPAINRAANDIKQFSRTTGQSMEEAGGSIRKLGFDSEEFANKATKAFNLTHLAMHAFKATVIGLAFEGLHSLITSLTEASEETKVLAADLDTLSLKLASSGLSISLIAEEMKNLKAPEGLKAFFSMFVGENEGIDPKKFEMLAASMNQVFAAIESARLDNLGASAEAFRQLGVSFQDAEGHIRKTTDLLMDFDAIISRPGGLARNPGAAGAIEQILGPKAPEFIRESQKRTEDLRNALEEIGDVEPKLPGQFKFLSETVKANKDAARESEEAWKQWADDIAKEFKETEETAERLRKIQSDNAEKMAAVRRESLQSVKQMETEILRLEIQHLGPLAQANLTYDERKKKITELLISHTGEDAKLEALLSTNEGLRDVDMQRLSIALQRKSIREDQGFGANFKQAAEDFKSVNNMGQAGIDTFQRLASVGGDVAGALTEIETGAKKGKEAFAEMARTILIDIQKIIIEKAVAAAISVAFLKDGGVISGAMSSPMPVRKFAEGGVANQPTVAIFGEGGGEEAFVPLKGGKIPVQLGNGRGRARGEPQVHFHITAMDGKSVHEVLSRPEAYHAISGHVKRALASDQPVRRQVRDI